MSVSWKYNNDAHNITIAGFQTLQLLYNNGHGDVNQTCPNSCILWHNLLSLWGPVWVVYIKSEDIFQRWGHFVQFSLLQRTLWGFRPGSRLRVVLMCVAVIVIVRVRGNGSSKRHKDTSMCVSQGRIVDDRIVSSTHTRTHANTHNTHTLLPKEKIWVWDGTLQVAGCHAAKWQPGAEPAESVVSLNHWSLNSCFLLRCSLS